MAKANPHEACRSAVVEKPAALAGRKGRRFEILGEFRYPANMGAIFKCREEGKDKEYLLRKAKVDARGTVDLTTWSQLRHENIARYEDAWLGQDDVMHLLCEPACWCLSVLLKEMAPEVPCRKLYPLWLYHIASGLEYMHEINNEKQPVLHRNLNAQTILVSAACVLKLFDFGDAKRLQERFSTTTTVVGCPEFRSPEIRKGGEYRTPTDVWSLGVTAAQVADYTRFEALTKKRSENITDIVDKRGHQGVVGLVATTLQDVPERRPSASQFVSELRRLFGEGELRKPPSSDIYPSPMRHSDGATKKDMCCRPALRSEERRVRRILLNFTGSRSIDPQNSPETNDNSPETHDNSPETHDNSPSRLGKSPQKATAVQCYSHCGAEAEPLVSPQNKLSSAKNRSVSGKTDREPGTANVRSETAQRGRGTHQSVSSLSDPHLSSRGSSVSRRPRHVVSAQTQTTDSLLAPPVMPSADEGEGGQRVTPMQARAGQGPGRDRRRSSSSSTSGPAAIICIVPGRRHTDGLTERNLTSMADSEVRRRLTRLMDRTRTPWRSIVETLSNDDEDDDDGGDSYASSGLGDSL